eukprot:362295-Chlamydomonas_euryale.AAC.5
MRNRPLRVLRCPGPLSTARGDARGGKRMPPPCRASVASRVLPLLLPLVLARSRASQCRRLHTAVL